MKPVKVALQTLFLIALAACLIYGIASGGILSLWGIVSLIAATVCMWLILVVGLLPLILLVGLIGRLFRF